MRMFLFILVLSILGCFGPVPAPYVPHENKYVVQERGSIQYEGKECKLAQVMSQPVSCPDCDWSTYLRFMNCGQGPVNEQWPDGKFGLK